MTQDDDELIRRIQARDQTALSALYDRYSTQIYSVAYRVLNNPALAEEAAQDAFLKIWRQPQSWDSGRGNLSAWLLTIARNAAIDRLRMEQRQSPNTPSIEEVAPPEAEHGLPHDPALHEGRRLRELLRQLPPEQAEVIEMAFFQGLTHRDLAEKLNLPLGTVKTRVRLGLQKLKLLWIQEI